MRQIIIHADDFGCSKGITDSILVAFDRGVLHRTSIITNCYAFDYAIQEWKKRPGLTLALHLNLVEGPPVSRVEDVPLLLDSSGHLHLSFQSAWRRERLSAPRVRAEFRRQIKNELTAQIRKFKQHLGNSPLVVDSHQHLHAVPFVFDLLLEIHQQIPIAQIRLPKEPTFVHVPDMRALRSYVGPNLVKHVLLRYLSRRMVRALHANAIECPDYFVGVLFSGTMSLGALRKALSVITSAPDSQVVEVLFHPGSATADEEHFWEKRKDVWAYYSDTARTDELEELTATEMRHYCSNLSSHETISGRR